MLAIAWHVWVSKFAGDSTINKQASRAGKRKEGWQELIDPFK